MRNLRRRDIVFAWLLGGNMAAMQCISNAVEKKGRGKRDGALG